MTKDASFELVKFTLDLYPLSGRCRLFYLKSFCGLSDLIFGRVTTFPRIYIQFFFDSFEYLFVFDSIFKRNSF